MKWTDVKPAKPGWWWFRGKHHLREVVLLRKQSGELWVDRDLRMLSLGGWPPGQWSDAPIAEPEGE